MPTCRTLGKGYVQHDRDWLSIFGYRCTMAGVKVMASSECEVANREKLYLYRYMSTK